VFYIVGVLLVIAAFLPFFIVAEFTLDSTMPEPELLPVSVRAQCSHVGCRRTATLALAETARELERKGSALVLAGDSVVFCEEHRPHFSEVHGFITCLFGIALIASAGGLVSIAPERLRGHASLATLALVLCSAAAIWGTRHFSVAPDEKQFDPTAVPPGEPVNDAEEEEIYNRAEASFCRHSKSPKWLVHGSTVLQRHWRCPTLL
jgi:hypothetical protein